ncbi:hypothetical protein PENTCL1PPCAC_4383, partial [Pristionchus entomophagus]
FSFAELVMMSSLAPPQVVVDSPRPQQHGNSQAELAAGIALFIRPPPTSGASTLSTCGSTSRKNSQKRKAPPASSAPPRHNKA